MNPLPATEALDKYFLEARCKLLDLAGILDRIDRGSDAATAKADARTARIREALSILQSLNPDRAAQIQQLFSLAYDPNWKVPAPR